MTNGFDISKVVASGIWLYDGLIPCRVFIQKEDVWPAFFDPEVDPSFDDKIVPCVAVWFENPLGGFGFEPDNYYTNVDEAKEAIEKRLASPIKWDE